MTRRDYQQTVKKLKAHGVPYANVYAHAAEKQGVSGFMLAAQGAAESIHWKKSVVECKLHSPAGARGVAQFMPGTAKSWGVNPCDVNSAIHGQARFMRALLEKYNWSQSKALAAYNAGPGAVDKYGGVPPYRETTKYVAFINQRTLEYQK